MFDVGTKDNLLTTYHFPTPKVLEHIAIEHILLETQIILILKRFLNKVK